MPMFSIVRALLASLLFASVPFAQVGANRGVANPNLAKPEELAGLPHMTEALAEAVVAQRPFSSMTQLHALLGASMGEEDARELYAVMFVPINLNTATRGEILLVPGVGKRMAHEFEEYRPYKAMAQFRREMGKYVDEKEVARLEQFVFVPLDLNTASEEDLATIPGVGKRMVHEFVEYRPYKAMAQFRREIGKYVDKKEIARLERYFADPGAGDVAAGALLDPNSASAEQLAALPHMTAALVEAVVAKRPFAGMTELNALVSQSVGEEGRGELYAEMFLPIDLNSATRAEILLIPGVGKRMAHEFEEYRPYKAMAQFRREIGKYVDEKEVARLERYVTIR